MNPSTYIPFIVIFVVLYILLQNRRAIIVKKVIENRKKGDKTQMVEVAKQFIGKDCIIYAFDGNHQFDGIIKEVTDGAILIEKDGKLEAVNLDFVIRIKEYPRNKKGKRSSFA